MTAFSAIIAILAAWNDHHRDLFRFFDMLADRIRIDPDLCEDLAFIDQVDNLHAFRLRQHTLQVERHIGDRLAARLLIGDPHRCELCLSVVTQAELDVPAKDLAGRDVVAVVNGGGADPRLLRFPNDRELLGVDETALVRAAIARRNRTRRVVKLLSNDGSLFAWALG